jgi:hypothetical protein
MTLAIDPGSSGAAILRSETGQVAAVIDYEGPESIAAALKAGPIARAVIERVWASPVMGVSAAFAFGENYGAWCTAITLKEIPLTRVLPQEWQRAVCPQVRFAGAERKRALKLDAQRRFPALRVTLRNCDALLISEFALSVRPCA